MMGIRAVNTASGAVRSTVQKGTGFLNRNIQKGVEFAVEKGVLLDELFQTRKENKIKIEMGF